MIQVVIISISVVALAVALFVRHQRSLRRRAWLTREAIRNHDWTFSLSTQGLTSGERAMQETLNDLGEVIRQQVSQGEVESWERLMRVLTHEIMNSTAPIVSISQSMLGRDDVKDSPLAEGIHAIYSASKHLSTFVDSYRKLSQLQQPVVETVCLSTLIPDIQQLYPDIIWQCSVADDAIVSADPNMLRQILINLVKNAVEAGARRMASFVAPSEGKDEVVLLVSNDGQPIPAETRANIFVPFFTTKRSGNGIGLSLARRMMLQMGGRLELSEHSRNGYTTTFILALRKKTT